jgi:hypothetical protein
MRGNSHVRFGEEPRGNDPPKGTAPRGLLHAWAIRATRRPALARRAGGL